MALIHRAAVPAVLAVLSWEGKERPNSCPALHIPPLHSSGFP